MSLRCLPNTGWTVSEHCSWHFQYQKRVSANGKAMMAKLYQLQHYFPALCIQTGNRDYMALFVVPAPGMARYRDPVFHSFVHLYVMTTLALTLLFRSVTLKPYEILWQNLVQI